MSPKYYKTTASSSYYVWYVKKYPSLIVDDMTRSIVKPQHPLLVGDPDWEEFKRRWDAKYHPQRKLSFIARVALYIRSRTQLIKSL